ncbi:MAG: hypothetical protein ACK5SX_05590 [Sandaracinobacter sp.]
MMRYTLKIVSLVSLSVLAVPASAEDVKPTGLALQQVQSRDFEANYKISFSSVMSVLQDSGYIIEQADRETGLIVAVGEPKSAMSYNIFWGFGRKTKTARVSATLEEINPGLTKIRLNFVEVEGKSAGNGINAQSGKMVVDPVVYRTAFEKIEQAIFIRTATSAPAAPAPAASAPVNPQ